MLNATPRLFFFRVHSELARAAVDHQTSVAPSKRMPNFNSTSLDLDKKHKRTPSTDASGSSVDWSADNKESCLLPSTKVGMPNGRPEISSSPVQPPSMPPPPPPPSSTLRSSFGRESSTDASGEDIPFLSDVRASGSSLDSGGGGEDRDGGGSGPLRIWAPLSRDSSAGAGRLTDGHEVSSPTWSAESDTDLLSPVGFWREKFETIDARNATRRFSGWGDNGSEEESSPEAGKNKGKNKGKDASGDRGRPPRQNIVKPRAVRQEKPPESAELDVSIGRALFTSPEKTRPSAVGAGTAMKLGLEPMEEGPESPYSSAAPVGGPHPSSFWATNVEPTKDLGGGGGGGGNGRSSGGGGARGGGDEKEAGALGWRRGEAGLVVPEPRPPKTRSVTIQQVLPQRGSSNRIVDGPRGSGQPKEGLPGPRPATTSPTLPPPGEHKSKMPKEIDGLSQGVKITRSYSYHGLGSMALYDYANRG